MADKRIFELSELDQIMPRLYVRWLLCFPLSETSPSKQSIIDALQAGVILTLDGLPVLRGHLVPKVSDSSRLEVHTLQNYQGEVGFELKVNHLDDEDDETIPTYQSLKKANFPVSEMPDKTFTPPDDPSLSVFDMMATFIRGGVLLCIKCHHAVVDGGGLGLVIKLLAQNCDAKSHSVQRLSLPFVPSVDRGSLPPSKPETPARDLGFIVLDVGQKPAAPAREYGPMTSQIFKFPNEALQQLKKHFDSVSSGSVTSHDALTALLYGAVSYARSLRFSETSSEPKALPSTMGIAVDGRRRLKTPIPEYAGNVTMYARFSNPLQLPCAKIPQDIMKDPSLLAISLNLPALAEKTHSAVAAVTHEYITDTISLASSLEDVSRMQPSFSDFYQGTDFFITSGASFPVFDHEWWPGGAVDALRIPLKAQWDGSCAVLATKDRSQGLDVLLGLREDDMKVVEEILFAFGAHIQ
ncbi:uncharacterized protein PAC_20131 [Phialocephala subalpina]|uniref:Trichothecene 3-O-acetyltransferase-like N-terminal domain-containing protein n=1 Tax=Phialocephala subalpina TaxID=576137 RepID=A0A1L7XZ37_9HELO|nr:uncharacterized protein PAC_20131 [Phialocephala subalpina]